jgi:hypothetical protein
VNAHDKNFTKASIHQEGELAPAESVRLKDKIAALKAQMQACKAMEAEVHAAPD